MCHHGAVDLDSLRVTPLTLLSPGEPLAGHARQGPGRTSSPQLPAPPRAQLSESLRFHIKSDGSGD